MTTRQVYNSITLELQAHEYVLGSCILRIPFYVAYNPPPPPRKRKRKTRIIGRDL
jgi:hypothetical protein